MMASKAIKPVYQVFSDAGIQFDETQFVPTVSGYYTDSKTGHLLSQPFNSSTPVLYYNKDAFKKAGLDPEQPPKTWQDLAAYTAKLKAAGMKCGYASGWQGWIQIENFSAWHGLPVATKNNGFDGTDAVLEFKVDDDTVVQRMLARGREDDTEDVKILSGSLDTAPDRDRTDDPLTLADPITPWFSVKEVVLPFARFPGVDTLLGLGDLRGGDQLLGLGDLLG